MKKVFQTDLRCSSCVESITPALDAIADLKWSVDTRTSPLELSVETAGTLPQTEIEAALTSHGYKLQGEVMAPASAVEPASEEPKTSYKVLIILLAYLLGVTSLIQFNSGHWNWMHWMSHFMAGFFLIFSFFKLLDLKGFAFTYQGYDLVASRVPMYGYVYPFLELGLGVLYLLDRWPLLTNIAAIVIGVVSTLGVINTLRNKKKVKCACLGTGFNLPMSTVTLVEDLLMVGMAIVMLWML